MKFNIVAAANVTGPEGPMNGWYLELDVDSQGVNGQYGSFQDLVPNAANLLTGAVLEYVEAQLLAQSGVTVTSWDYVQITTPSTQTLYQAP